MTVTIRLLDTENVLGFHYLNGACSSAIRTSGTRTISTIQGAKSWCQAMTIVAQDFQISERVICPVSVYMIYSKDNSVCDWILLVPAAFTPMSSQFKQVTSDESLKRSVSITPRFIASQPLLNVFSLLFSRRALTTTSHSICTQRFGTYHTIRSLLFSSPKIIGTFSAATYLPVVLGCILFIARRTYFHERRTGIEPALQLRQSCVIPLYQRHIGRSTRIRYLDLPKQFGRTTMLFYVPSEAAGNRTPII